MKKLIVLALGFFMSICAFSFPPGYTEYSFNEGVTGTYQPTVSGACAAWAPIYNARYGTQVTVSPTGTSGTLCYYSYQYANGGAYGTDGVISASSRGATGCPPGSTLVNGNCVCDAGFNEEGGKCVADSNPCAAKAGKPVTVNFTVGFTRTDGLGSNSDDYNCVGGCNAMPADRNTCSDGCQVALAPEPVAAWRSTSPTSNGLYRLSLDFPSVPSGQKCTPAQNSASAANKNIPSPPCPGFVGEVNGKTQCVGTAAQPVPTNPIPRDLKGSNPAPGNPAAGDKPTSGAGSGSTGSGRTPAAGDGGNAGGPASSASGPTGSIPKSTDTTSEQANCGAPGQPKCRIDESGSPSEIEALAFKSHADKYKTEVDAMRGKVSGADDKQFFSGWASAFVAPPLAECTPFELPEFAGRTMGAINPCPVASGMRSVMAWIWALGGLLLCLGMVRKAI